MKRRKRRAKKEVDGDLHIMITDVHDHQAASDSCRIDAAKDRDWFQEHPERHERQRTASFRELKAFGHPFGTQVIVRRGPEGLQIREFVLPVIG